MARTGKYSHLVKEVRLRYIDWVATQTDKGLHTHMTQFQRDIYPRIPYANIRDWLTDPTLYKSVNPPPPNMGRSKRGPNYVVTPEQMQLVLECYLNTTVTLRDLAAFCGMSTCGVYKRLKRLLPPGANLPKSRKVPRPVRRAHAAHTRAAHMAALRADFNRLTA